MYVCMLVFRLQCTVMETKVLFVPQLNKFMRLRFSLSFYCPFFILSIFFGLPLPFPFPSFSNPCLCFLADIDIESLEFMYTKS